MGHQAARAPWAEWPRGWRETTRHWVRACLKPEGCWQELGKGGAGEPWFPLTPGSSVPPGDAPRSAPGAQGPPRCDVAVQLRLSAPACVSERAERGLPALSRQRTAGFAENP